MQTRDYKPTVKVVGAKSKKRYDDAVALGDDEGKAFVDAICYLLSAICYLLSAICYLLSAICSASLPRNP